MAAAVRGNGTEGRRRGGISVKVTLLCFGVLCAALLAWCGWLYFRPASRFAEVLYREHVIMSLDLSLDREVNIPCPDGGHNLLKVEGGAVRVASADCPNKDCVKMGVLRSSSLPLVCLPHSLTVRFANGTKAALDGVSM